uniref:Uncharacterized protein n=1 Tax=Desertifilum tharense IPPAS B-1220 TaxID=1781255 RepID=A0ACD5GNN2_9CYAN
MMAKPLPGEALPSAVQGQPNATLDINVVARVRVLGGVISAGNETLINQSVRTDANGNFTLRVPPGNSVLRDKLCGDSNHARHHRRAHPNYPVSTLIANRFLLRFLKAH